MSKKMFKVLLLSAAVTIPTGAEAGIVDWFKGLFGAKVEDKKQDKATAEAQSSPTETKDSAKEVETPAADVSVSSTPSAPGDTSGQGEAVDLSNAKDDAKVSAQFSTGEKITVGDVKKTRQTLPVQMRNLPVEKIYDLLQRLSVDAKIVSMEARKAGYHNNPKVVKAQEDGAKAHVLKAFMERKVKESITEKDLEAKYEALKKMIPENEKEYKVSHILVKTASEAKSLINEVKSGKKTFKDALAKSLDKPTKEKGGELGWLRRLDVPADVWTQIEKTKTNGVVSTPLSIGKVGFSVLMVTENRKVEIPALKDVRDELLKAMTPEFSAKTLKAMKKDMNIKLFNLEGKEIPEKSEEELRSSLEKDAPAAIDASKLDDNMVVATYKGGKLTLKDVKAIVTTMPQPLQAIPLEKIYELLLINTLNKAVLQNAAAKAGIEKDPEIAEDVARQKETILQNMYIQDKAKELITDKGLRAQYDKVVKVLAGKNEMEYRLRHILVETLDKAKDIMKQIKSGKSFDSLVSESKDFGTIESKGELGYVRKSMLPKGVGDIIAKAPKGTMIPDPINFGEKGYSIMRVEDKRAVSPPKFEQVKGELERAQVAEKGAKVLEEARKKYSVKRFKIDGTLQPEAPVASKPVTVK